MDLLKIETLCYSGVKNGKQIRLIYFYKRGKDAADEHLSLFLYMVGTF